MSNITPYRTSWDLAPTKPKDTFGILRAPKTKKQHTCNKPSWFARMLYSLIGNTIPPGSLYRCGVCKNTFRLELDFVDVICHWHCLGRGDARHFWKALGGDIGDSEDSE